MQSAQFEESKASQYLSWRGMGGGGGVAGENVFNGKIFRDPNMTPLMFFGYPLRSFKRIQDPLQTNMANESSLLLLKKTSAQPSF